MYLEKDKHLEFQEFIKIAIEHFGMDNPEKKLDDFFRQYRGYETFSIAYFDIIKETTEYINKGEIGTYTYTYIELATRPKIVEEPRFWIGKDMDILEVQKSLDKRILEEIKWI